ncbi:helix-turn-helix transcriptional regulator [Rathayibacter sp. ZW T2_19]|uniref:Helix-turn-helix transcriptional regulator n=2 Tax=Rathayibacter rubneri TaxID=2950106 RepID=A0A9X2DXI7_9MICO|nr:helix-turn-helix transcriptional regulator [Rathayibacter rubneri]MCM6761418.1 helix-turn-helix transcriptional regulator [Rathayibacter rubneri]
MQPTHSPSIARAALVLNRSTLDALRRAHGIESEAELARVIGVDYTTLYRVSEGKTVPSNEFMAKVAGAFPSASLDTLFTIRLPAEVAA